jgi:hypothetical protein
MSHKFGDAVLDGRNDPTRNVIITKPRQADHFAAL